MNELIDRLGHRLEHLADTADAHRDIDGVIAGTPRTRLEATRTRQSGRMVVQVAAAAIALAGVGGIIAVAAFQDFPSTQAPVETDAESQPTAPTTTVSEPTAPATTAANETACRDGEVETTVPNVGGMAYLDAVDTLSAAGLDSQVAREVVSADVQPELGDGHVILWQDPTPGAPIACGAVVQVTATILSVYLVQPGDTWESIAATQAIPVEDLLDFNDFTIAELEAAGGSVTSPIEIGRVIRLSLPYRTLETAATTTTG